MFSTSTGKDVEFSPADDPLTLATAGSASDSDHFWKYEASLA